MLIYGNTPDDIIKMILKRKYKLLSIAVLFAVAIMLILRILRSWYGHL